jgi:hypothetical protein
MDLMGKSERRELLGKFIHKWNNVKMHLDKQDGAVATRLIWLRINTDGRL